MKEIPDVKSLGRIVEDHASVISWNFILSRTFGKLMEL